MKQKTVYVCQNCGASYLKWQGQCAQCQEWNSLVEEVQKPQIGTNTHRLNQSADFDGFEKVVSLGEVLKNRVSLPRLQTGIGEFDRVMGLSDDGSMGMVPGAVMLLGGEPGVGKSTLLTQVALRLIEQKSATKKAPVLYICGEESPDQIGVRIERIIKNEHKSTKQKESSYATKLRFAPTTSVDTVVRLMRDESPSLVIVDSIQTLRSPNLTGAAGSVGQVRECADILTSEAKRLQVPLFLVGHVTKDGTISGPKILEHMVDAVLELTGERTGELRLLRALKNRFGPTDEVGVFRIIDSGYEAVPNPSALLLDDAHTGTPGSAVGCVVEGTRPLMVEVQALVVRSQLAMPRRVGRGIELSRIQVLAAVLQKHCKLAVDNHDVFLSLAGGFRSIEPAVDLAAAVAVASSLTGKPLPKKAAFIGEVGLLGEIRAVPHMDRRLKEAKRLGFTKIYSKKTHTRVSQLLNAVL